MSSKNKQISLKPQDLLVLLKIAAHPDESFTYARYARALGISASELHASISRLELSRLVSPEENQINLLSSNLFEFVIYGAVHFFPAVMGPATRGIPTGYAAPPLKELISQPEELPPVWPDPKGSARGLAVYPLYPSVPAASNVDQVLYENLALFDALRVGAAREREAARQILRERL